MLPPALADPANHMELKMTPGKSTLSHPTRLAVVLSLMAAFGGGYALHDHLRPGDAHAASMAQAVATETASPRSLQLPDFSDIAAHQGQAVVNISVTGTVKTAAQGLPDFGEDSPFGEFFRRFGVPGAPGVPGHGGRMPTRGQGSGFIVDADGIILTNAHVVADADEVIVKLTDKREFKAKVVGLDKPTDVAVLKIDAGNLPVVKVGNPEQARVGEWVVAIGSPFGFENSVTAGIISAKSRRLSAEGYVPFMQTDVAVNPGNSGGPLLNARGEVIGINSQIFSRSGGYQGLSFAIPIDVAMNIERQLVTTGKVSRGRLGVSIQDVNQELAESFGLDRPRGALVSSVEPGSPAAKAGIEVGDIILRFNGREVAKSDELPSLVGGTAPGSMASIELWRKGASKTVSLAVGELKTAQAAEDTGSADSAAGGRLGLAVRPLNSDETAGGSGGAGVAVEGVAAGPAARAGIRAGDVILAANGQRIASPQDLRKQVDKAGDRLVLLVKRGERNFFVPIRIG